MYLTDKIQKLKSPNAGISPEKCIPFTTSRLPVRSKSKSLSDRNSNPKDPLNHDQNCKIAAIVTESNQHQPATELTIYSIPKLQSPIKRINRTEIKSRGPNLKLIPDLIIKSHVKHVRKVQVPRHRNNSSCGKLSNFDIQTKHVDYPIKTTETRKENGKNPIPKVNQETNTTLKERHIKRQNSIFRLFRMKIDLCRQRFQYRKPQELKSQNDPDTISPTNDTSIYKISGYQFLDHPLTKDFLRKLYNECRKLNGNIVKLSNDTNDFNNRFKNLQAVDALLDKYQKLIVDGDSRQGKIHRSTESINRSLTNNESVNIEKCRQHQRSHSEYISAKGICKSYEENNGHYYHLACVLSTDPDPINLSGTDTKGQIFKENKSSNTHFQIIDEIANAIVERSNSSFSAKTHRKDHDLENQQKQGFHRGNNAQEFDDTLCDLDDDMETDSLEDLKINLKDFKSPISLSSYLTAIESNTVVNTNNIEPANNLNVESSKTASFELPPRISLKDFAVGINSETSFTDIEPPDWISKSITVPKPTPTKTELTDPVSKFVAVYEKQFPHQVVLINPSCKQVSSTCINENQDTSNYTSSITVNCYNIGDKKIGNRLSRRLEKSHFFFNPFKPPKCMQTKLIQYSNSNNNNSSNPEENSNLANASYTIDDKPQVEPIIFSPDSSYRDSHMKIDENNDTFSNDNSKGNSVCNSEEPEVPLKRVAPLKQLLMHSRNSDKMNSVFTSPENEGRTSPSCNSYIEIQRQKKIVRQQEQHQKAKDMAVEAAKFRKERQAEIKSLDSFDSSRIVERLFMDNNDNDYPDFSLFDACHYNFTKIKIKKPRPLAQSTITGILPEEPESPPEPVKSPVTTEKFRNDPIQLVKRVHVKKEISKQDLEKYEPIGYTRPPDGLSSVSKSEVNQLSTETNQSKNSKKKPKDSSSSTDTSSSSPDLINSSTESVSSYSSPSSSESQSLSKSSESSKSSDQQTKSKKEISKTNSKSKTKQKSVSKERKVSGNNKNKILKIESSDNNISVEKKIEIEKKTQKIESSDKNILEEKEIEIEIEKKKPISKKKSIQLDAVKFDEIFLDKEIVKRQTVKTQNTNDAKITTEDGYESGEIIKPFKKPEKPSAVIHKNEIQISDPKDSEIQSSNVAVECHINHTKHYNEDILDRQLLVNINIPIPDTSLSGFVQELNSQLHSLADTVDILMNRMENFEANLMDSSKYFVYK